MKYYLAKIKNIFERRRALKRFKAEYHEFKRLNPDGRFSNDYSSLYPCLFDNTETTDFDAHYIYHPAWAAKVLAFTKPAKHIDISSILSFGTGLSAFVPVEFYDYRPAAIKLDNYTSQSADLINLPFESNSVDSISCMHTIEHVGLGRYGDPLDPDGDLKSINELKRVTKPGGTLLFVTPVGKPVLRFNAHRIYSFEMIQQYFEGFALMEFALVDDAGNFTRNALPETVKDQNYGCGCFWFRKHVS